MFESALSVWSLASLVSKFYTFICSTLGWLLIAGAYVEGASAQPSDSVSGLLHLSSLPSPNWLTEGSQWLVARSGGVTIAVIVLMVAGTLWSVPFLARNPGSFDRVRGPATAWAALAVLGEVHGAQTVISVAVFYLLTAVVLCGAVDLLRGRRYKNRFNPDPWACSGPAVAFFGGLAVTILLLPLAVLTGLGGMPTRPSAPEGTD